MTDKINFISYFFVNMRSLHKAFTEIHNHLERLNLCASRIAGSIMLRVLGKFDNSSYSSLFH
jgi:hypothetical protein